MKPLPKALIQLADDRAAVLGEILTRLTRQALACKSAENLVRATREAVIHLHTRCSDLLSVPDTSDNNVLLTMETEGRLLNTFLEFLENQVVPLLERCNIVDTPPEFVAPIVRVAHVLYPESDVLVVSLRESNYKFALIGGLLYTNFRQVACNDFLTSCGVPENLRLLQFCAIPPNGVLNHSLMAHELAHGLYQKWGLATQILASVQIDEDRIEQLVDSIASSQVGDISDQQGEPRLRRLDELYDRSVIKFRIKTRINETVNAWIEEFACDIMGICLFGPAFLFSQLFFMIPVEKLDDTHDSHPSLRMRLQYCFNSLLGTEEGLGYRKSSAVPMETYLLSWREAIFDKNPKVEDKGLQIAYDIIRPVLPLIRRICKRKMRAFSLTVKKYDDIVPQLCSRLSQVLPPNEYCDTEAEEIIKADFVSILNAGWVFHLGLIVPSPNFLDTLSPEKKRKKVLLLIQLAVEISELQKNWVKESISGSPQ